MKKALVVLSGGQDSTTCLYLALSACDEVHAVTFNYGQKHVCEIYSARNIASMAGIADRHEIVHLDDILKGTSPLVNPNVQLEQYKDHQSLPGGIEKTFVPMRNQLFLTLAANRAVVLGCDTIYTGVCEEDYGGYPDCRRVFIEALQYAINLSLDGTAGPLVISSPLMRMSKAATVKLALRLPGCYKALAYSHTAYNGQFPPTSNDHANLLRAKGFEMAGVPDPLVLRAVALGCMEMPVTANYAPGKLMDDCQNMIEGKLDSLVL